MKKDLSGLKVALLVANGFAQNDMVFAQKALLAAGANVRIVSSENGLVNGWEGRSWGHNFAVDAPLSSALSADYSALVVPGGQRSAEKLNLTAHTKRFLSSFIEAGKPVTMMDDALRLLILCECIAGRTVSGPESMKDMVMQAGGLWCDSAVCYDDMLMTGATAEGMMENFINTMVPFCSSSETETQAA